MLENKLHSDCTQVYRVGVPNAVNVVRVQQVLLVLEYCTALLVPNVIKALNG